MADVDPFFNEPEYEGPYNAAHGFQSLKFADLQVGNYYVMKEMEKYTAAQTGEITYQTYYYYIFIVAKTPSKIKFIRLMSKGPDVEPWELVIPDPDQEVWQEEELEKKFVNGPEVSGGGQWLGLDVFMRHFYEPFNEAGNALSTASSTFSNHNNNNGESVPDVNYIPIPLPELQSPQLSPVSSYYINSNSNYNGIGSGRRKRKTKRRLAKAKKHNYPSEKLKKTRRNKKGTQKRK